MPESVNAARTVGRRPRAKIAVLLATHNGMPYLSEQLDDILVQLGDIHVFASDDGSTDGSREYLEQRAREDSRITVLPKTTPTGSAAGNFYRLLREAPVDGFDAVAFSDQDDRWMRDKLAVEVDALRAGADAVSSDVVAFDDHGLLAYIKKSYRQRSYDWLLESSGPGSTFVMTPALVAAVREVLDGDIAPRVDYHDWLVYAVARASGMQWRILDRATVEYRQHGTNVIGANRGPQAARSRLRLIRQSWHRDQALLLAELGVQLAPDERSRADIATMEQLVASRSFRARLRLASRAGQLRRRPREQWIIGLLIILGIW